MSAQSRRKIIEQMLSEEPLDTFLRYSLALELAKEGEHETSIVQLRELMHDDPPYVPAFFMCGQQLASLGRTEEARECLRRGIEQARTQNDQHAAGEMADYLANLGELE